MEQQKMTDQRIIETPERLVWHKPDLQLLRVTLETAAESKTGSAADGPTMDRLVGGPVD